MTRSRFGKIDVKHVSGHRDSSWKFGYIVYNMRTKKVGVVTKYKNYGGLILCVRQIEVNRDGTKAECGFSDKVWSEWSCRVLSDQDNIMLSDDGKTVDWNKVYERMVKVIKENSWLNAMYGNIF